MKWVYSGDLNQRWMLAGTTGMTAFRPEGRGISRWLVKEAY
jgi:hypothetical protein